MQQRSTHKRVLQERAETYIYTKEIHKRDLRVYTRKLPKKLIPFWQEELLKTRHAKQTLYLQITTVTETYTHTHKT